MASEKQLLLVDAAAFRSVYVALLRAQGYHLLWDSQLPRVLWRSPGFRDLLPPKRVGAVG